jgi:hypothetical protein
MIGVEWTLQQEERDRIDWTKEPIVSAFSCGRAMSVVW